MTLLLDAHALLWFLWDDPQLSSTAKTTIESERQLKLVSIATCWEITIKTSLGKLDLGETAKSFLTRELRINGFPLLPMTLRHVTAVERLPYHHRDLFGRVLIARLRKKAWSSSVQIAPSIPMESAESGDTENSIPTLPLSA